MNLSYLRQSFLALYTLCHISSVWMRSLFFKLSFADASRIPVISEAEAEHSRIESTCTTTEQQELSLIVLYRKQGAFCLL